VLNASLASLLFTGLVALVPAGTVVCSPRSSAIHFSGCVFVADGAGDFRAASKALRQAVGDEHLPLDVETFPWSHGYCRVLSDQIDRGYAQLQGHRLAEQIRAIHLALPHVPIYLVGHSAGCAVILIAAEALPPGLVQRIVLLAPSVPASYDLRPALRCAREGVDVFSSPADNWYLKVGMLLANIMRPGQRLAAGCSGFRPVLECPDDGLLYAKLTQYPWEPCLAWTGHHGGHFGCYQQTFLRVFVLPLLTPGADHEVSGE
jgi:pimeloyl-ACP methyl ester carboxylesterase